MSSVWDSPAAMFTTREQVEQVLSVAVPMRKATLLDNAVLLRLKFSRYGTSRKVAASQYEVQADKGLVRVTKQILTSTEADAIDGIDRKIRSFVESFSIPSGLDEGLWFVPMGNVDKVNARMKEFRIERVEAIERLCDALPEIEKRDAERLRDLHSPADYPTPSALRASYSVDWWYVELVAPRSLQAVSEEVYTESKRRMEQNIATATETVQSVLRSQFKELLDHLVERLTPDADGGKKTFRKSTTENFREFLGSFRTMNITEDSQLDRLVSDAKRLMEGVDADSLRTQDTLRTSILSGFEQIKGLTDQMIEDGPLRLMTI